MTSPVITLIPQNARATVALSGWCPPSGNYDRQQILQILPANTQGLTFGRKNANSSDKLLGPSYTLRLLDPLTGALVRSFTTNVTPNTVQAASFSANLSGLFGWYRTEIVCPTGETNPAWFIFVKGSAAQPDYMPVCTGSFDVFHGVGGPSAWTIVPAKFEPTLVPLAPCAPQPFSNVLPPSQLYREYLVPMKGDVDILRSVKSVEGVVHSFNQQSYAYASLVNQLPSTSLLDGPRGRGSLGFVTHLMPSERPDSQKIYFSDPWRIGRIDADGTITTLAGYRHGGAIPGDKRPNLSALELVGDWSQCPAQYTGFHEVWGWTWDGRTLATDPNAAPIGGEQPHTGLGPVVYVANTRKGCINKLQFNGHDRSAPVKVTAPFAGLDDPWDCVALDGVLYVAERGKHRIVAYDLDTGAFLRVVISGAALSHVDASRFVIRDASIATIRAQPCVSPEGLFIQDGWLYFGSFAMQQVKRVHLTTGAVEVVGVPSFDGNSRFVKFALSDGTFMPRGTAFCTTWSSEHFGMPEAILPGGTKVPLSNAFSSDKAISQGRGGWWEAMGYAAAVGCGKGWLFFGTSIEGVARMRQALPSDPAIDYDLYRQGYKEWFDRGLDKAYGFHGFGYYGLAAPAGLSPAIDCYLQVNGTYPSTEDPAMIAELQAALAAAQAAANQLQAQIDQLNADKAALANANAALQAKIAAANTAADAVKAALA